jgi:hypothetical protein
VAVVIDDCAHANSCCLSDCVAVRLRYLRAATTSAGCTIWPVLFDQLFLV